MNKIFFLRMMILVCVSLVIEVKAVQSTNPILIISSYNPDTRNTTNNISEFMDEYYSLKGKAPVVIENMNCKSFSEAYLWKDRMASILLKYFPYNKPRLIIIIGQEGWGAYLAQPDSLINNIPVLGAMISSNAITLPDKDSDMNTWEPQMIDLLKIREQKPYIGGIIYDYDIDKNISLIKKLYPATKELALITDNTYGGLSLKVYFQKKIESLGDLKLIELDGRKNNIYEITSKISKLPYSSSIILGTWRVDKNDEFFIRNATYSMMAANPEIPTFSLTALGLNHWSIGGYSPQYRSIGKELAHEAMIVVSSDKIKKVPLINIPNHYLFDYKKIKEKNIDLGSLKKQSTFINEDVSILKQYRIEILIGTVSILTLFLIMLLYINIRIRALKDKLLKTITKLKNNEKELRESKEKAEESDRLKTAFLANMSHEIRTPLNAIVGFSNLLPAAETKSEQEEYVNIINTNNELLLKLINDILDVARIESGNLDFTYTIVDLNDLFLRISKSVSFKIKPGVETILDIPEQTFMFYTDENRLTQILINLITNSAKFTEDGFIHFGYKINKNELYFYVKDSGIGIDSDKRKEIFERFVKLNHFVQGSGLGLSICKMIIERLNGRIGVDSEVGQGSTFWFVLPIKQEEG